MLMLLVTTSITLLLLLFTRSDCYQSDEDTCRNSKLETECKIFIAPSSIEGAGFGVFTTKPLKAGDIITTFDYGPAIPIIDIFKRPRHEEWTDLFRAYIWSHPTGATVEMNFEADAVVDFQPGLGIYPNFHTYLSNIDVDVPTNDATYDFKYTSIDPGNGANSHHAGRAFRVTRDVHEGGEMFLDYGEDFLIGRPDFDHFPRKVDYKEAGLILKNIAIELKMSRMVRTDNVNQTALQETEDSNLRFFRQNFLATNKKVGSLLPQDTREMKEIAVEIGSIVDLSTIRASDWSFAIAKRGLLKREAQWIRENGTCLDNIKIDRSILPHAGNGAKARRALSKGDIISPMPLLQIKNQSVLHTHKVYTQTDGTFAQSLNEIVSSQILLNYCFGHVDSSLLLLPTTNGFLANHCSDSCKEPNAEIRWGEDETTQMWLNMSLDEIAKQHSRGLSLELVATKEIGVGEEIFIDYGKEWTDAWSVHLESRKQLDDEKVLPVSPNDHDVFNVPENQFTACYFWEEEQNKEQEQMQDEIDLTVLDDATMLSLYGSNGSKFTVQNSLNVQDGRTSLWPCTVIDADDNDDDDILNHDNHEDRQRTYTVRIFPSGWHTRTDTAKKNREKVPILLTNYPASSIRFFYKPYQSPLHSPHAFRHFVGIPSHMMPSHWLDKKISDEESRRMVAAAPGTAFGTAPGATAIVHQYQAGDMVEIQDIYGWIPGMVVPCNDEENGVVLLHLCVDLGDVDFTVIEVPPFHVRWSTRKILAQTASHPYY